MATLKASPHPSRNCPVSLCPDHDLIKSIQPRFQPTSLFSAPLGREPPLQPAFQNAVPSGPPRAGFTAAVIHLAFRTIWYLFPSFPFFRLAEKEIG